MALKKDTNLGITADSLVVGDPLEFRPTELPLVIKPPEGKDWANREQAAYARVLNAAAYSNKLWSKNQMSHDGKELPNSAIKDVEVARLIEIGNNPDAYYKYTGEVRPSNDPESPSPTFKVSSKNVLGS